MAGFLTRTSAGNIIQFPVTVFMDGCDFSSAGAYHMGLLVDINIGPRYNWFGCNHGGDCSSFGILFNYALVENTMAKLKYELSLSQIMTESFIPSSVCVCGMKGGVSCSVLLYIVIYSLKSRVISSVVCWYFNSVY